MKTDQRLVAAATALLDTGGERAVTIRAVAQAVGMSHNAPYKHFDDRRSLLRAVALKDFATLTNAFADIRQLPLDPLTKLKKALATFVAYAQQYPARYRLLLSDPGIAAQGGDSDGDRDLEAAALRSFTEVAAIVQSCQDAGELPGTSNVALTSLIYASVHGLIDLQAGGRMRPEKGLTDAYSGAELLVELLRPARGSGVGQ